MIDVTRVELLDATGYPIASFIVPSDVWTLPWPKGSQYQTRLIGPETQTMYAWSVRITPTSYREDGRP